MCRFGKNRIWDYAGHDDDESLGGDGADAAGGAGVALRSGTIFSSGAAGAGAGVGDLDYQRAHRGSLLSM